MLQKFRPYVIFLSETRGSSPSIDSLKSKWNLNGFGVSSIGNSRGLALLWKKSVQVNLASFSENHIGATAVVEEGGDPVRITSIYGEPKDHRQHITWSLLRSLCSDNQQPWFVGGDFNEILNSSEKEGGRVRRPGQMMAFNMALKDCGLSDLGYEGCKYTWSNNRPASGTVSCRLDRVCANQAARLWYPLPRISHIKQPGSDHIPIILRLERAPITHSRPRCRPFRFEAMWVQKNDCEAIVQRV